MAADDLRCLFHLTPRGWLAGKRWYFGTTQQEDLATPEDVLATFELHIKQSHPTTPETRSWKEVWRKAGTSTKELDLLMRNWDRPDESTDLPMD